MAFPVFPTLPGINFPVVRTPIWSTLKQDSWSGKSSPIKLWTSPRRRYSVGFDILRSQNGFAELQTLEGFFNSVGGSSDVFAFTDVDDQTTAGCLIGTGDGVTSTFQLLRPWGGFYEPVYAPRAGFTVYVAGQANVGFTIGSNPGQLIFSSVPANGAAITWTGAYDWLCRFDDDTYDFSKFMNGRWSLDKLSFTTVKL